MPLSDEQTKQISLLCEKIQTEPDHSKVSEYTEELLALLDRVRDMKGQP